MIGCPVQDCAQPTSDGLPCNHCTLKLTDALQLCQPETRATPAAPGRKIHPRDIRLPAAEQRWIDDWPAGTHGSQHQPWEDSGDVWCGLEAELDFQVTRQTSKTPQVGGRGGETVIPFNGRASDAAHEVRRVLTYWTFVLVSADPTSLHADHVPLASIAKWMAEPAVIGSIRSHEAGPDMLHDIITTINDAIETLDTRQPRAYAGRCTLCGHDLYTRQGADEALCKACEGISVGRQQWLADRENAIDQQLIERSLIVKAMPVIEGIEISTHRVGDWIRRGRLQPAYRVWLSKEPDPRPAGYAIADIRAAASSKRPRRKVAA